MGNRKQLSRQEKLELLRQRTTPWDMVVVGGGITGAGVALMAARAGLEVLLLEKRDYAWGTSSRSSKMVHGGLRYLSQGELKLARQSVREREKLLKEAPGLIEPMNYLFPFYEKGFPTRSAFSVLLNIYGYFAGKRDHTYLNREQTIAALPGLNEDGLLGAYQYTDALTDDSRLVLRVLADARRSGALTLNYTSVNAVGSSDSGTKEIELQNLETDETFTIQSKTVVNATGVWADDLRQQLGQQKRIRPLRGSHIIIPSWRLPVHQCLTYLHPQDKRGVFIYPWMGRTVIGTTDLDHTANLDEEAAITAEEVAYLLKGASHNFPGSNLKEADIISTWSGVRPIVGNEGEDPKQLHPSKARRDHVVWDDEGVITVTGGKLTTFRVMAQQVLETCAPYLQGKILAEAPDQVFEEQPEAPDTPASIKVTETEKQRLTGCYGPDVYSLLAASSDFDFSPVGTTSHVWAELEWAVAYEEVVHLDDLLLRRTRIGLVLEEGGAALASEFEARLRDKLGRSMKEWRKEWQRYQRVWQNHYSLPSTRADKASHVECEVLAQ